MWAGRHRLIPRSAVDARLGRNREQMAHVLRAASGIVDDPDILIIGSQSLLASYDETELPRAATASMEVSINS